MNRSIPIAITDSSYVGEARRLASDLARRVKLNETDAGRVSLVATEAANNLFKHARHGQVILRPLRAPGGAGVEILSLDMGPGMADVARCLEDGFSTAGSPGTGLGAIQRASTVFDIFSQPGAGTALVSQIWNKPLPQLRLRLELGVVCVPKTGETDNGDGWDFFVQDDRYVFMMTDGLGHGRFASQAAETAVRVFGEKVPDLGPVDIIQAAHGPLRPTRGAGMVVLELNLNQGVARYAGVGNIAGIIFNEGANRNMVSHNGTVGHEMHRVQEFTYPWTRNSMLLLHTDGLHSRWNLDLYPGLRFRHPAIIAGVLYRDFQRGTDDTTVLVARERA